MAFGQVSTMLLQELCKCLSSINKRRPIRSLSNCPQTVDELQNGSDSTEIFKVESGALLDQ